MGSFSQPECKVLQHLSGQFLPPFLSRAIKVNLKVPTFGVKVLSQYGTKELVFHVNKCNHFSAISRGQKMYKNASQP
jgi:hypothetical protein